PDSDLNRQRWTKCQRTQFGKTTNGDEWRLSISCRAPDRAVNIDLPARKHSIEARMLPKFEVGDAGKPVALLLRAVIELDILHQSRLCRRFDLCAHTPRLGHGLARTAGNRFDDTHRPRQTERSVEARRAGGQSQHSVDLDAEWMIHGIDVNVQLEYVVVRKAAGGKPVRVALTCERHHSFTLDGTDERAGFAAETHL